MKIGRNLIVEDTVFNELVCGFNDPSLAVPMRDFSPNLACIHLENKPP